MTERPTSTVVILAGGEATRLPGKLFLDAGDTPLIVRVYRNVKRGRPVMLSCKGSLPADVDAHIDAPAVVDRWTRRGPLSGLLSTMGALATPWVFAVAGDAPFVDAAFIDDLERRIEPGDEAVLPRHVRAGRTQIEPLAALYARHAFLREGLPVLLSGNGALRMVIDRLSVRYVDVADPRVFANVNTAADYDDVRRVLS